MAHEYGTLSRSPKKGGERKVSDEILIRNRGTIGSICCWEEGESRALPISKKDVGFGVITAIIPLFL